MGVEYGLYDRKAKRYLRLGKRVGRYFQCADLAIAAFIATFDGPFEKIHDAGPVPELDEEGWTEWKISKAEP